MTGHAHPLRRRKGGYFERTPGAPAPLTVRLARRVGFHEADVMGIAWHGRYLVYFEEASAELRRACGLSYEDFFAAGVRAPIVQAHVDYHRPLFLDEPFTIRASMLWHEGARLNIEYTLLKQDESAAATGYTVQMFTSAATDEPFLVSPPLLERCRQRWRAGELKHLA